ncbi:tyrosine-protein phosphatase [Clostridium sardiniense]|uniref:Tyrosine-protein phosphatase n=1 Tax=Clostridium sardiniense TaxID=29369 RepID=A0ABS7KWD5_CLOSR|nr:tyrosine-protein phosphatase [Clostridium sardiniense]MBY0755123.1 tyrosine-protein phosphatase [Clostridium sardiniense]MDQ0459019.1 protein-tyrosine phosphatase [Clostridium sardiniense]
MKKLNGNIIRGDNGEITIKLNRKCSDLEVYYSSKLNGDEEFLKDFKNTDEIKFMDPEPNNRTFYKVKDNDSDCEIILAERIVPLEKFSNFRDLGGYDTKDGRRVKWGLFYRSEDLFNLKGDDLEYFKTLGIKYVLDYRSKEEADKSPDVQVEGVKNINISAMSNLGNDNLDMASYVEGILKGDKMTITPKELLIEGYKSMPLNNPAFKELFKLFKNPQNTAILQHCTAGKDRTGIGSALILLALNVPEETVILDYLESNNNRKVSNEKVMAMCNPYIKDEETKKLIEGILGVNRDFIGESLKVIKDNYSSYDEYFEKEYDLNKDDLKNLRNTYLY